MTAKFSKSDKFEGVDFRRWQKKMHFLLTTLKVVYMLSTPISKYVEEETVEQTHRRSKWENDDYIYRGHILNGMSDTLFDIYQNVESAKALWDALEAKYMAEDASSKKFLVSDFNNYKMVDFRPVMEQYNELLQESLRAQENGKPKGKDVAGSSSVNMVEDRRATKINDRKGKRKVHDYKHDGSNKKSKLTCWKCGKSGLRVRVEIISRTSMERVVRVKGLRTIIQTKDDDVAWWIDSGATTHACKDRGWFKAFQPVDDGSVLHMGNESSAPIVGVGSVVLNYFWKNNNLSNVLYVPNFHKNLVSGFVLNKCGFRQAVVRLPEPKKKSLGERGIDCIFIGYAEHSKAYRFYVIAPNDFISVNTMLESRDAIFDETRFSSIPRPKKMIPSSRDEVSTLYPYCFNVNDDPKIFDKAIKSQDVAFWKEAINDEMDSIMGNNTWVLADLPPGCKPLGCKWIFKKKMKVDGTIEKFKARLVIQGFRQRPGIDYFDTYAPVALSTPMDPSVKLMPNTGKAVFQLEYSKVIDCLMCAMTSTRTDIAYAVGKLSRFTSNPSTHHWQAIRRVLKYLQKTMDYGLSYSGFSSILEGYSDASWITNV
ncbi:UNVERIFIED_CONTAM: Retrovirus-related Pol polyprotein from transposon RE2 [Sesamum latifolium]|uniref:Retrovirus-related Pol polyprotein from transposon RE2 n=1 Tax=Sesamum latifolium TaxID=2727402 RepID=A0AAW2X509_9LAMI